MAIGYLGKTKLAANMNTAVYSVPAGKFTTANVAMCNIGDASAKIRLAIVDGAAVDLADEDYIEYGTSIPAGGIFERSALTLSAGETVVVWADKGSVTVRVHGYEEA